MKNLFKIIGLSLLIYGCKKNDIQWELERNGESDFFNPSYYCYKSLDCNDTVGFKSIMYIHSWNDSSSWYIQPYSRKDNDSCLYFIGFFGKLEFTSDFEKNTILTFWALCNGRPPDIYVDDKIQDISVLNVDEYWTWRDFGWVQVKLDSLIPAGLHKVKFECNDRYNFHIDDIGFYKLKKQ